MIKIKFILAIIVIVAIIIYLVTSSPKPSTVNKKKLQPPTIEEAKQEKTNNSLTQEVSPSQTSMTATVEVTQVSQVTPTVTQEVTPATPIETKQMEKLQVQAMPAREYVFYQGLDSGGNDIRKDTNKDDIERLKEQCDKEEKCIGFNTNGWLKNLLIPFTKWTLWTEEPNKGFYRVKTAEIPAEPAATPFQKECTYVQTNAYSWHGMGYDDAEVKKIDLATADDKAKYCEVGGDCYNPNSGGSWCFKPTNGYPDYYDKTIKNGVWASDAFKCEGAIGRNITGNNGDYANYCMFDEMSDAQNYCSQDPKCKGILAANNAYMVTRENPIVNTDVNGSFYRKPGAKVKLL